MTNVDNIFWTSVVFCVTVPDVSAKDVVKSIIESGCSSVGYTYNLGGAKDFSEVTLAFSLVQI